jgi:outer membrane receptor protein involved in Fe transport
MAFKINIADKSGKTYKLEVEAESLIDKELNQIVDGKVFDLDPEKGETIEGGFGFKHENIKFDATYYHTKYTDKIESVTDLHNDTKTINAGQATHQGVELSFKGDFGNFDTNASTTHSRNRWDKLNFKTIFHENAADVEDKVVPFSPETMVSGGIGYTIHEMPLNGNLRIGFAGKWTDDYYTTYDNVYCKQLYYYDDEDNFVSMGEHEFVENLLGTGRYDYDEDEGYIVNFDNEGDYDREWILQSSKLPAFFELNGSIDYKFYSNDGLY